MDTKGKVYIIGTGPGDYKLMTLKAIECIKKADVVVHDRLGSKKIIEFTKRDVEIINVGKLPDNHAVSQWRINEILAEKAMEGKTVARVKGGDPFVFGRGGEEALYLHEKGIEFEIVPGITSAISVPAYAGIPVTHRDYCSSFHVITGHEMPEKENSMLDFSTLAKLNGTLVFLMGVKNLPEISNNLIKFGKDPGTPAAVIENGTTMEQRTVVSTLGEIVKKADEEKVKSPAIIIVGEVVGLKESLSWFPFGKLMGKRVLVTRSREQASQLTERIEELGGEAVEFPTIKITDPSSFERFDYVLDHISEYKWLVFTSINGVEKFFDRMVYKDIDIRSLFGMRICAVGSGTKDALKNRGIKVDLMPENYTTESLLPLLLENVKKDEKILLARADIGNKDLSKGLEENGLDYEDLVIYRTQKDTGNKEYVLELLKKKLLHIMTFTSSSTVRNFVEAVGEENLGLLKGVRIIAIGPVTKKTAEELGLEVSEVADKYTIEGLVEKF